jgi:xanthine dehydrogenase YagR molybdenum-binding subunit
MELFQYSKKTSVNEAAKFLAWAWRPVPGRQRAVTPRCAFLCWTDGTARATCATQDIGTGTYTVFAAVISDRTGIPLDKIQVQLGDSALPPGPPSGGSSATVTVLPAIAKATDQAVTALLHIAALTAGSPFEKADPDKLHMTAGRIHTEG